VGKAPFVAALVGFARALRDAGVTVGTGDVLTYCAAMDPLDPTDVADLYWGGRTTLIRRHADLKTYDEVFARYFLGEDLNAPDVLLRIHSPAQTFGVLNVPQTEPDEPIEEREEQTSLGLTASDVDILKAKAFAACTEDERAALRRIMTRIRLTPPRRLTRRTRPAPRGRRPDLPRTVRNSLRTGGDPLRLRWRARRHRLRPLVLFLDVSGSMADYSRALMQFAYSTRRAAAKVEVFCFGSRLTRITRELEGRDPDAALDKASRAVVDWDGGTRIGESLHAFLRRWGRRGVTRGAVVVICSDGLDRGDPELLDTALERLSRQCHRLVWVNPHLGDDPGFRAQSLGMMVAAPHVDRMLPGHDLRSLERLAALLPDLR
jgi:hypothetical protein